MARDRATSRNTTLEREYRRMSNSPPTEPNLRKEIERLELLGIPLNKITGSDTLIDELLSLISHYTDRQVLEARIDELSMIQIIRDELMRKTIDERLVQLEAQWRLLDKDGKDARYLP